MPLQVLLLVVKSHNAVMGLQRAGSRFYCGEARYGALLTRRNSSPGKKKRFTNYRNGGARDNSHARRAAASAAMSAGLTRQQPPAKSAAHNDSGRNSDGPAQARRTGSQRSPLFG